MSQEPTKPALEQLTEETADAIIFTIGATPGDPKQAITQLLLSYLKRAHEQQHQGTTRANQGEQEQQN